MLTTRRAESRVQAGRRPIRNAHAGHHRRPRHEDRQHPRDVLEVGSADEVARAVEPDRSSQAGADGMPLVLRLSEYEGTFPNPVTVSMVRRFGYLSDEY